MYWLEWQILAGVTVYYSRRFPLTYYVMWPYLTYSFLFLSDLSQDLSNQPKSFFENVLIKAISQKGANVYQNFKVTKVVPQTGPEYNGKDYVICDFRYELITGAGFDIDRRGVASLTSEGPGVEVLWAASTRERYETVVHLAVKCHGRTRS